MIMIVHMKEGGRDNERFNVKMDYTFVIRDF
jgi:hypothetical protein